MKVGGPRQKKGVKTQGRERQITATQKKTDEESKGQVLLRKKKTKVRTQEKKGQSRKHRPQYYNKARGT